MKDNSKEVDATDEICKPNNRQKSVQIVITTVRKIYS